MYNQSRIYIYLDLILNDPLLATKFFVPPLQTNLVHRQRLLDRLDESIRNGKRLTLISTPAGYGKTTLLGEWVQRSNYSTAWLSLDEGDNDPVKFMTYLIYALREIKPDLQCPAHLTGSLGRIAGPLWAGFVFDLT